MSLPNRVDVVILGGGLAGMALARQLLLRREELDVVVLEASDRDIPRAAFKIGESSVEVAGRYFRDVLELADHVHDEQLPKLGLRYFFTEGDNTDISSRLEVGPLRAKVPVPFEGLLLPSFQLDRGLLERHLASVLPDGVLWRGARVTGVDLKGDGDHEVTFRHGGAEHRVRGRWVLDATGRRGLLKQQLELALPVPQHVVNSVWFRLDRPVRVDSWSDDPAWQARIGGPIRWHSTVHLLGEGYWCWIIPLVGDRTSVGIVFDERLHRFDELKTFGGAQGWLDAHEPQLAGAVRAARGDLMDFMALPHFSMDAAAVTGGNRRWGVTGEAGLFADPFYSPGSDFIAIANTFHADLILRELDGEDIGARGERATYYLKLLYNQFMEVYRDAYFVMGVPRVMTVKLAFDNAFYWGWVALLAMNDSATDPDLLDPFHDEVQRSVSIMNRFQAFLRDWAEQEQPARQAVDVDQFDVRMLWAIYSVLVRPIGGEVLHTRLSQNLDRLELFCEVVFRRVFADDPRVQAAAGIDVHRMVFDPARWDAEGTLLGEDRGEALVRLSEGLKPLWIEDPQPPLSA